MKFEENYNSHFQGFWMANFGHFEPRLFCWLEFRCTQGSTNCALDHRLIFSYVYIVKYYYSIKVTTEVHTTATTSLWWEWQMLWCQFLSSESTNQAKASILKVFSGVKLQQFREYQLSTRNGRYGSFWTSLETGTLLWGSKNLLKTSTPSQTQSLWKNM